MKKKNFVSLMVLGVLILLTIILNELVSKTQRQQINSGQQRVVADKVNIKERDSEAFPNGGVKQLGAKYTVRLDRVFSAAGSDNSSLTDVVCRQQQCRIRIYHSDQEALQSFQKLYRQYIVEAFPQLMMPRSVDDKGFITSYIDFSQQNG